MTAPPPAHHRRQDLGRPRRHPGRGRPGRPRRRPPSRPRGHQPAGVHRPPRPRARRPPARARRSRRPTTRSRPRRAACRSLDAMAAAQVQPARGATAREFGIPLHGIGDAEPGHRPRHRAAARPDPAGDDDRLRRLAHQHPRRVRGARVRDRDERGRDGPRHPDACSSAGPKTYEVRVDGRLTPGVSAKDIILALIARIGIGGGTGHVFEYTRRRRSARLTMEQRMTICNMSIEGGARAGLIAPDDTTFEYLARPAARARRAPAWDAAVARWRTPADRRRRDLRPDDHDRRRRPRADGHLRHEPRAWASRSRAASRRRPTRPTRGQRRALERALEYMDLQPGQAILGQKVDVVFVGCCTNGRISDLRLAAERAQGPPRRRRRPADGRARARTR